MTSSSATDPVEMTRAHERLLAQRLPLFALAWLADAVLWTGVLFAGLDISLRGAAVVLAGQGAVVGVVVSAGRARWARGRMVVVLVAGCVVLGLSVIATFAVVHGDPDFLGFVLLTLFLASSLSFAWGWQPALLLIVITLVAWVAFLGLTIHGPAPQLSGAAVIGAALSLGVAEGYWRGFVATVRHEAERDAVIARERAALAEAERARRVAEEATAAKDRFLAVVSHELRSPLGAALHWAFIVRRRTDPVDVARALDGLDQSIRLAGRLLDDLLDVSRATQGKLALQMEEVDLRAVVSAVVDDARFTAHEKGVTVTLAMPAEPVAVYGDPGRLRQVADNLVSNAVKFTPRGGRIEVAFDLAPPDVTLTVRDTGIGIAAAVLPYVFEPFHQGPGRDPQHGGLGLGLAIVRYLVQAHGGGVEAASDGPGLGATFRVRLRTAAGDIERPSPPALDHVRVLLVDEETRAGEFVRALLERCGADVISVASVGEALDACGARRPDVLVADVVAPRTAGRTVVATLRDAGGAVPAVAFGAGMTPDEREELTNAGFQICVTSTDPAAVVAAVADVAAARIARG